MYKNTLGKTLLAFFALFSFFHLLPAQKKGVIERPDLLVPLSQKTPLANRSTLDKEKPEDGNGTARTTTVNPIALGSMGNLFGSIKSMNNCIYADDSTGALVFIHRNDPTINGGTAFGLRYDISTDAGATWNTDVGELNPTTLSGRYPQVAGYHTPGSTSPLPGKAIWLADHYDGLTWSGFNVGSTDLATSGTPPTQESIFGATEQLPSGGMTMGLPGEYWAARFTSPGGNIGDSLKVFKGVYNTGTQVINWAFHSAKVMPWNYTVNGTANALPPSVAFSPDGTIGWIATLGDLVTASDSIFAPILMKSTDGGATWGTPTEIDLNVFPWVYDSLRALWMDTVGNPISSGQATAAFDYDLTVDAAGNPHLFFVMGSAALSGTNAFPYSIQSAIAKYAVDLTSSNQGSTFDLRLVAPVLTFRSATFGATSSTHSQDNYPQVSRTQDGNYIFYTWVDSDTSIVTGSMMGVGFGESANIAPNLWMAGLRVNDGFFTCVLPLTQGDLTWEGRAISPQMAPEVLVSGSGASSTYNLPIVMAEMPAWEPIDPCNNYYFGNDAVIQESDFAYAPGSTITWIGCGVNPGIAAYIRGKVYVDNNANGTFDGGDVAVPNLTVATTGITNAAVCNVTGDYSIRCAPNITYGLAAPALNPSIWTLSTPASPYSIVPAPMDILTGYDFGYQPVSSAQDLSVTLLIPSMRPGFTTYGVVYVSNLGAIPTTGTLTLDYDMLVSLTGASPTFATNNTSTHQATWNLPMIPVFGSAVIHLDLYIPPTIPLNTNLTFGANVATTGQDVDGYNNVDATNVIVIGSYDPNDKAVSPAGLGSNHQVTPGTELSYRIRCQNTGTASAINVVVRDTLDTDLDITTFKMLGASHPYVLSIDNGRFLTWDFSNINLPDSFSNEPGSHAHIDYSIRPKANRPLGTVVDNSASIYFDFNAPVLTNNAWITYDVTISTVPSTLTESAIRIYPHPVGSRATVEFQRYAGKSWAFELYDLQGRRLVYEAEITSEIFEFERGSLPAGAYVYKVTAVGNVPKVGRLVLN
jgi:uncharacterized repeat protein (TIGR01451 family)